MNDMNQNLAENLSNFLFNLKDDVVKGLQDYIRNNTPLFEVL